MRVLLGGIGYRHLRDHSLGVLAADLLAKRDWRDGEVVVEDLSYNPIALVQRLQDEPPERRFDRVVLVSAVPRPGRRAGTVEAYRWDGALPGAEAVQAAVAEAVTGVVSLDNALVVGRQFDALPSRVAVVEAEPEVEAFGDELSPSAAGALTRLCELAERLATDSKAFGRLVEAPLGGGRLVRAGA